MVRIYNSRWGYLMHECKTLGEALDWISRRGMAYAISPCDTGTLYAIL